MLSSTKYNSVKNPRILFLGETYRADAQSWIMGIEKASSAIIETAEIRTIRFKPIRAFQAAFFIFRLFFKRFFSPAYDFVLAERSTSYGFFSLFTNARVKIVAQQGISDIYPNTFSSRVYKKLLQRIVYKNVDLIHAWSSAMVPAMLASGADHTKILVRPKGIDLDLFKFSYNEQNPVREPIKAIVTRSLLPEYNHHVLLDAIFVLKQKGIRVELTIVGDGPLLHKLMNQSKKYEIEDFVSFKGRIPNHELPHFLSEADLYLSVPITEGASGSLMEAMAVGVYPIVTRLPGNLSFIKDNINGKLVDVGSVDSLVSSIESFHAMSRQSIGDAVLKNRQWVEAQCDRSINMAFFWNHYQQVFHNKNV